MTYVPKSLFFFPHFSVKDVATVFTALLHFPESVDQNSNYPASRHHALICLLF